MRESLATPLALGLAALAALAGPPAAAAGELRVLVSADGSLRQDGNYLQVAQPLDDGGEPLPDGEEDNETIARTGLRLDLSYGMPRSQLALTYHPSYEESLDHSDLSNMTHALYAGMVGELSRRSRYTLSDRFVSSRNFESTPIALTPTNGSAEPIAVTRRGDQLTNSFNAGVELDLTRRTGLVLGGTHTLRTFEETDLLDSTTAGFNGGFRFNITEERTFSILAGAHLYEFEDEGDAETIHGGLGYGTDFARDGRLYVEGGGYQVDSRDAPSDPVESHSGFWGALGVNWQREIFSWGIGLSHGVDAGIGLGRAVLADSLFAGISAGGRVITVGLSANASSTNELDEEDRIGEDGEPAPDSLVDTAVGTLRVTWNFAHWGALTGGYSRIWQEAEVAPYEDLSYSRYFLGLGLRLYESGERPLDPTRLGDSRDDEPDAR